MSSNLSKSEYKSGPGWGVIIIIFIIFIILFVVVVIISQFALYRPIVPESGNLRIYSGGGDITPVNNMFFQVTGGNVVRIKPGHASIGNILRINNRMNAQIQFTAISGAQLAPNTDQMIQSGQTANLIQQTKDTWLRF